MAADSLHIARAGQEIGTYNLTQVTAMLASGQLLPTDFYWRPGMADWKPLASLTPSLRQLPFPRPTIEKPNLLDTMLSRQHRTEGLALFWDLLASSPTECIVSEAVLQEIETKTGVNVRSRCQDELKVWYKAAIADYLSDQQFTPQERINLDNLAQTFGFKAEDVLALNKEGFGFYFQSGLQTVLNRQAALPDKVKQIQALMHDLPLAPLDAASIRQDVLGDYFMNQLEQGVQKIGDDEILSPEKAAPIHRFTEALGSSLESFGPDLAKRMTRAESAWQLYCGPLTEVSCPLELGREKCYWTCQVDLVENRRVIVRRNYGGFSASTKSFFGVRYRMGSFDVQRITEDQMTKIDHGTAVFTEGRVLFNGAYKNFNFKYSKVVDITEWNNGIQISRDSGGDIYFIFPEGSHQATLLLRRLAHQAKGA